MLPHLPQNILSTDFLISSNTGELSWQLSEFSHSFSQIKVPILFYTVQYGIYLMITRYEASDEI